MAPAAGAWRSPIRSADALRAARLSAMAARALFARVHQPAEGVVLHQRLRAGYTTRLHRTGSQERIRYTLLVRRHDRFLGRQQACYEYQVSAAGRLHALVADDEQSI